MPRLVDPQRGSLVPAFDIDVQFAHKKATVKRPEHLLECFLSLNAIGSKLS